MPSEVCGAFVALGCATNDVRLRCMGDTTRDWAGWTESSGSIGWCTEQAGEPDESGLGMCVDCRVASS